MSGSAVCRMGGVCYLAMQQAALFFEESSPRCSSIVAESSTGTSSIYPPPLCACLTGAYGRGWADPDSPSNIR